MKGIGRILLQGLAGVVLGVAAWAALDVLAIPFWTRRAVPWTLVWLGAAGLGLLGGVLVGSRSHLPRVAAGVAGLVVLAGVGSVWADPSLGGLPEWMARSLLRRATSPETYLLVGVLGGIALGARTPRAPDAGRSDDQSEIPARSQAADQRDAPEEERGSSGGLV